MDSPAPPLSVDPISRHLPGWTATRGTDTGEADAAVAAGAALAVLDGVVRAEPAWAGCWRARQALKCAVAAVRLMGRGEDEAALRDAILLAADGDDAGPSGRALLACRRLARHRTTVGTALLEALAVQFALAWDDRLASVPAAFDDALQSGRSPPFAVAALVASLCALRPDAEALAWWLADRLLAERLGWDRPVPLLMAGRYGPAYRLSGGRGRIGPGDEGFGRAVCLALAEGTAEALRAANEIGRRALQLQAAAPRIRTKGAAPVLARLLDDDAVLAAAPGTSLSRWASRRLFERLERLGAVRELSGRSSFRIYGL